MQGNLEHNSTEAYFCKDNCKGNTYILKHANPFSPNRVLLYYSKTDRPNILFALVCAYRAFQRDHTDTQRPNTSTTTTTYNRERHATRHTIVGYPRKCTTQNVHKCSYTSETKYSISNHIGSYTTIVSFLL